MTTLSGTTVLLTGASSGIGAAAAGALAARGARLLLTGRDAARLADVARPLGAATLPADLAAGAGVDDLADWALRCGPPRVVVHNAGAGLVADADATSVADLERLWALNVTAPVVLTQRLLPTLRACGGHVLFVTSIAGLLGVPRESAYAASKAAVQAYARSLRTELAPAGVRVTTVAPGVVATPFFERRGEPYDRRFPRPMPAERVGETVAEALEHDRAEVVIPRWLRLPVWMSATAPDLYHRLASRFA